MEQTEIKRSTSVGAAHSREGLGSASSSTDPIIGIVHDVGNLIQIASSALNIVSRSPQIRGADLNDVIDGARKSLEKANVIVRQTIGLGRDRFASVKQVSVTECMAEIEALIEATWERVRVVDFQVGSGLMIVKCDPIALQSAVLNLLLNARDATPKGGRIHVRADGVALGAGEPGIEISVIDRGVGMTPDTATRAFEPFFTTKTDGLGGAGLPMAERFAHESGGRLFIESEYGIGTTVRLQLPTSILPMDKYLTS